MPAISLGTAAKILNLGIGQNNLFKFLREHQVLMAGPGRKNVPYQRYVDRGYFQVIIQEYRKKGLKNLYYKTILTQKGLTFIRDLILQGKTND